MSGGRGDRVRTLRRADEGETSLERAAARLTATPTLAGLLVFALLLLGLALLL